MKTTVNKSLSAKFLLFVSLLISTYGFSQDADKTEKVGQFKFESELIDYGTIEQNADGVRVFKFTNVGDAPIVISKAKGSCGCTVPTYSKNVIEPGDTGEIQVKYATNRIGKFTKTVTLTSNASEPEKVLRIKGEVLAPATTPTTVDN
ncbi:MAG TPA: DUF1573 domain-containing protein [Flavobacteriaceae bacterium]|nr:DUF1573 domain-containing protein [Flavobacteriaceae bacterium]MCB9212814.1 DUF1573 domain-containing protein [Alteromonas sp.]HPF12265.1 DUF1573 domain-containing protein [Flavobacteriaceae bacterium]HQU21287.1 DUF1573 domain-containing protein [Flavobacteriaceae bacterium]HQU66072.1 DUF1573 domain-containing protein [Flavobacteriaceae bacterium]